MVTGPVFSTGVHDFSKVGIGWPQRPSGSRVRGIRGLSVGTNPWPSSDRFGLYAGSSIRKSPQRSRMTSSSRSRRADRAGSDLSREERLSNEEVRELLASGLVELGSHTMTHADLTQIVEEEKKWEIEGSKDRLKELFRVKVSTFCYPFGLYGEEDVEHARHADYKAAVTVQEGISDLAREDLMQLKRVKVSGKEGMFSFRLRIRTGRRS